MKNQSLSILFVIKLNKKNKKGMCPLNVRITYLKKRKEISSGIMVNPAHWDAKLQMVISKSFSEEQLNQQLEIQIAAIRKSYLKLKLSGGEFNVEDIFTSYLGKPVIKDYGLIQYFKEYLNKKEKLIGKDIQYVTWKKSNYVYLQLVEFIKWKYGKNDLPLNKLKPHFINDFEYFLKTERRQVQITINKTLQRFRKPVRVAVSEGYLEKDPFAQHLPGRAKKEVVFLSSEELDKLEKYNFTQSRLALVKDLFVFCCYTGLAYREMSDLKKEHIVKGFDGNQWIQMKRHKTDKMISVPLLPKAKAILDKYNTAETNALPKFSNQKINSYLKEIAGVVGINKSITHHMARKTFASTVLLYNDVPMEIVSELLGHSSMKITQEYYGKIIQKKVGEEMKRISKKLK